MFIGYKIGPYIFEAELGKGGFGKVWLAKAENDIVQRKYAVKLPIDEKVDFEAIRREAELWLKVSNHKNIISFIEAKKYDEKLVIVSEFANGGDLYNLLKGKGEFAKKWKNTGDLISVWKGKDEQGKDAEKCRFSLKKAVEILHGILAGLEHLHSYNAMHLDLKPQNILLKDEIPCLADFGISKILRTDTTFTGIISFTYQYAAPEALTENKATFKNDIWAVGVIFQEMLTGILPFEIDRNTPLYRKHDKWKETLNNDKPKPLPAGIPQVFREFIAKCLQKNPTDRYENVDEMREALNGKTTSKGTTTGNDNAETKTRNATANEYEQAKQDVKLIPYRKGDKWGFCDVNKNLIIEVRYRYAEPFSDGLALVGNSDDFIDGEDFIDNTGNRIITLKKGYSAAPFRNEFAQLRKNDKFGFIDKTGNIIIPPIYNYAHDFSREGVALVSKGDHFMPTQGVINKKGEELIPIKYRIEELSEDLFSVSKESVHDKYQRRALFDKTGNQISKFKYDLIKPFSEGLAVIRQGEKYGFIDTKGNEVIPPQYNGAEPFKEGLAAVQSSWLNKWGFIDKTNRKVISLKYDRVRSFSEGWAMVAPLSRFDIYKKPGFIDKDGNTVLTLDKISCLTEPDQDSGQFSEGLAFIPKDTINDLSLPRQCITDKRGNEIIEPKYAGSQPFSNGVAFVKTYDRLWGLVDKRGREIIPPKFKSLERPIFIDGLARVSTDNSKTYDSIYYIDKNGTEYFED